jgi:hypothetical protein
MTSAKRCADCAVDLVEDLAAFEQRRAQEESERMLRVEGPAGWLAGLEASLSGARVPVRRVDGALEVPLAEQTSRPCSRRSSSSATARRSAWIGPRGDVEPGTRSTRPFRPTSTPPARRPAAARASPPPSPPARRRRPPRSRCRAPRAAGTIPIADFVVALARANRRTPLYAVARLLADPPEPEVAARLARELPTLPRVALESALHALALLGDRSVARAVVHLLDHEDADVRAEADEVLMSLTGIDVQFDAEADARTRGATIRLWRERIDRELGA